MTEENTAVENQSTENSATANSIDLPAFFGVKAGMTRIFDENGNHVPVTVVKLIPNIVTQVKTVETDGYEAYQVGYGEKREKLVKKPMKGHLKKANVSANLTKFAEIKNETVSTDDLGKELSVANFTPETYVDVTGVTKGKGFQGVMKRYNFAGGPASHGSHFHRTNGSIGNRATPGRVFKLKKMPGHMGAVKQTVQNVKVVEVNTEKGYMLIKGSLPGSKNGFVKIAKALKK
ncbi:50S ribosomal protein L3 [Halobacteriovorax marinus]|uniref:50S ribosomal protein L3 n=1 Tax=Halobacteriovorax marinus TaxID=97084 RepID=UPI000BC35DBB|nr:50S ribosomal protein L3 [Halobacteriovorax marinus]ATH09308.1 50S ribosomal protein L3 [Halobacteriovorax marinus]